MRVALTHPGVYVEEIPSRDCTITGVATSTTAFLGRAQRGPMNDPVTISSVADFERLFGGLWTHSTLGFAVRDFYRNGGSQGLVVRLAQEATAATLDLAGGLNLVAANPGSWGNELRVRVDHAVSDDVAERFGLADADDLFNLTVRDGTTGVTELFSNISVEESPRQVDKVLEQSSSLVRTRGGLPGARPDKHGNPGPGKALWDDNNTNTTAAAESGTDGVALDQNRTASAAPGWPMPSRVSTPSSGRTSSTCSAFRPTGPTATWTPP